MHYIIKEHSKNKEHKQKEDCVSGQDGPWRHGEGEIGGRSLLTSISRLGEKENLLIGNIKSRHFETQTSLLKIIGREKIERFSRCNDRGLQIRG